MDNLTRDILEKENYYNPLRYISGRIIEYDIKAANVSILFEMGYFNEDQYRYYIDLPKMIREREIGLLQRENPKVYDILADGLRKSRLTLGEANNLDSLQIIRIAKDAVYVNSSLDLQYTNFGKCISFKQKNIYNVYLKLLNTIVFVSFLNDSIDIDIKGLGNNYIYHQDYMLNTIGTVVFYIERGSIQDALNYLSNIIDDYINRRLDIGYYRNFDPDSMYEINVSGSEYKLIEISDQYKENINIQYNLFILRELWSIVVEIYNRRK